MYTAVTFTSTFFGPLSSSDGVFDIGRSVSRWNTIYAYKGNFYSTEPGIIQIKRNVGITNSVDALFPELFRLE